MVRPDEAYTMSEADDLRRGEELVEALHKHGGHFGRACRELGISRSKGTRLCDRLEFVARARREIAEELLDDVEEFALKLASGKVRRQKSIPIGDGQYERVEEAVVSDRSIAFVLQAGRAEQYGERQLKLSPQEIAERMASAGLELSLPAGAPLEKLPPALRDKLERERLNSAAPVEAIEPPGESDSAGG